MFLWK